MKQVYFIVIVTALLILTSCSTDHKNDESISDLKYETTSLADIQNADETFFTGNAEVSAVYTTVNSEPVTKTPKREVFSHTIKINCIYQEPELPTGCEITSLAMVLNYLGYDISKTELAQNYLEKDYSGKEGFDTAFIGDPAWDTGYGCFAPVIVKAAQQFLNEHDMLYTAWDISGTEFKELYEYINKDIPVIIWCSMGLMDVYKNFSHYDKNGREIYWYDNEHCVVLCGYDNNENTVTAADPLSGMVKYDADRFEYIYGQLEKQAVIIY